MYIWKLSNLSRCAGGDGEKYWQWQWVVLKEKECNEKPENKKAGKSKDSVSKKGLTISI